MRIKRIIVHPSIFIKLLHRGLIDWLKRAKIPGCMGACISQTNVSFGHSGSGLCHCCSSEGTGNKSMTVWKLLASAPSAVIYDGEFVESWYFRKYRIPAYVLLFLTAYNTLASKAYTNCNKTRPQTCFFKNLVYFALLGNSHVLNCAQDIKETMR